MRVEWRRIRHHLPLIQRQRYPQNIMYVLWSAQKRIQNYFSNAYRTRVDKVSICFAEFPPYFRTLPDVEHIYSAKSFSCDTVLRETSTRSESKRKRDDILRCRILCRKKNMTVTPLYHKLSCWTRSNTVGKYMGSWGLIWSATVGPTFHTLNYEWQLDKNGRIFSFHVSMTRWKLWSFIILI